MTISRQTREALRAARARGRVDAKIYRLNAYARPIFESASAPAASGLRVLVISSGYGSGNANYYLPEFISSAVPLVEGADSYFDHPSASEERDRPERSILAKIGWFSDPQLGEFTDPDHPELGARAGVFATFNPRANDPLIESLLATGREKAAKYPDAPAFFAFSINAYGIGGPGPSPDDGRATNLMEKMTQLASVDVVTAAGARGRPLFAAARRESLRAPYFRAGALTSGSSRRPRVSPDFLR